MRDACLRAVRRAVPGPAVGTRPRPALLVAGLLCRGRAGDRRLPGVRGDLRHHPVRAAAVLLCGVLRRRPGPRRLPPPAAEAVLAPVRGLRRPRGLSESARRDAGAQVRHPLRGGRPTVCPLLEPSLHGGRAPRPPHVSALLTVSSTTIASQKSAPSSQRAPVMTGSTARHGTGGGRSPGRPTARAEPGSDGGYTGPEASEGIPSAGGRS